jgi:hypothetical protein
LHHEIGRVFWMGELRAVNLWDAPSGARPGCHIRRACRRLQNASRVARGFPIRPGQI